jgi:hypothetical protein
MKWKTKHITMSEQNKILVERGKIYTTNTQIHDRLLSCVDAGISIKQWRVYGPNTPLLVK